MLELAIVILIALMIILGISIKHKGKYMTKKEMIIYTVIIFIVIILASIGGAEYYK